MNTIQYLATTSKPSSEISETPEYHNYALDTKFNPVSVDQPDGLFGYQLQYKPAQYQPATQSTSDDTDLLGIDYPSAVSDKPQDQPETKYSDKGKFIQDMTAAYKTALSKAGVSTEYAKYLAAQDALESNYGKSYAGRYNYGNITVGSDKTASYTKGADTDGRGNPITQKFRNYDSLNDYAAAKVALLNGSRYKAFNGNTSAKDFYTRVKNGGYATDPNYVTKLMSVYNSLS